MRRRAPRSARGSPPSASNGRGAGDRASSPPSRRSATSPTRWPLLAALQAHGFATALPVAPAAASPLRSGCGGRRTARARRAGAPEPGAAAAHRRTGPPVRAARRLRSARPSHRLRRRLLRPGAEAPARRGADSRRRRRLCGGAKSTPSPTSRTTNDSTSSSPSASGSTREAALMRLLFVGDIVGRAGRTALINRLPALARALAARFRRRQRRERRRRLRRHRGDLRGVPRRRRRRDHARQPRLRSARGAGVHRAPAAPDPSGQLSRRHARARRQSRSRPRAARGCWSST